ncbi:flagellar basal body-associated FliL family protein [uncultured Desulfovibrio sp.]|uniref:Flagellar protein FliL n=1 Tax=Candidatus Desulfovibrio intestinavium TaxID=2838534 RepID=A0A9D2HQA9_9BACT|nr:flagellar basal body-associated FliL family protein [uncultured Desulfovibrio sp.]HJA79838.1 flagellar basal body-associated FliL family protein [Candidatus Desulfovibrio intestinavium]
MAAKDGSKESQALPPGGAEKPKKSSRVKRLVILLTILLITLSAAGGAAYWWIFLRDPAGATSADAAAEAAAPAEKDAAPGGAKPAAAGGTNVGKASTGAAPGAEARIEAQTQAPRTQGIVLPLDPIRVNLTDPSGRRYLTVGMEIEVNSDVSADLKAQGARINDAIIMLLAGKTYGDISTPEGKVLLKHEIAARLNQILGAQRVIRVYFTNFVVE